MKTRKILPIFASLLLAFTLTSCGNAGGNTASPQSGSEAQTAEGSADTAENEENSSTESMKQTASADVSQDTDSSGSSILVVYFSRTGEQYGVGVIDKGNTAIVADMIIDATGADSFEILPEEDYYPYTYDELTDVAKKEQNENARPAYKGKVPDLSQYDTVFIGAPVWWGDWPMICYTFFEENAEALAGKTLIPFNTNAGSGLSGFDTKLADECPASTVGEGLAVRGTDAQNDQDGVRETVNSWLAELGI